MLKEKNMYKKEKGITLVALVITVVVMLILAGVAIGSVTGDGLFNRTRQAAEAYENASKKESDQIQTLMNEIDEYLTGNTDNEGVDPKEVAVVGDFVNYSVQVDSNGNDVIDEGETYDKWRILDFDNNGHMEIVCYNGPEFTLGSDTDINKAKSDYANAIQILNNASIPYGEGTYGYSTRHLGSDPSNPNSYAAISTSYVKFYSGGTIPTVIRAYLEQEHHESDLNAINLFSNTAYGKKLAGIYSWLASRIASAYSSFSVRFVHDSGSIFYRNLYTVNSIGTETTTSNRYALAPVVSLESGVKINTSLAGNGSEDSPWVLTK